MEVKPVVEQTPHLALLLEESHSESQTRQHLDQAISERQKEFFFKKMDSS